MTAVRPEWVALETNLTAGLDWLTTVDQPDNAVVSQFGRSGEAGGGLTMQFSAGAWNGATNPTPGVVVFNLHPTYEGGPKLNPFTPDETAHLAELISQHPGVTVEHTWNGAPFRTFSVGIGGVNPDGVAHAYQNYRDQCPTHHTVFCGERAKWGDPERDDDFANCTWSKDGNAAVIPPTFIAVAADTPPAPTPPDNDDDRNLRAVADALELIRPLLAQAGYHPDTIVAGRRGNINDTDGQLSFEPTAGHGVCLPAEAAVAIVNLLAGLDQL